MYPCQAEGRGQKKAGLQMPPKMTPYFIWQGMTHPVWTYHTLKRGLPNLRTVAPYASKASIKAVSAFVNQAFGGSLSWDYLKSLREEWQGPILLKGVLHPSDVEKALKVGLDGVIVSNHGGRQFDGGPAAIEALPDIVNLAKGKMAILMDSGVRTGLDILKALALGADFVLLGRAFIYGVAALGKGGGDYVFEILKDELTNNMVQLGVEDLSALNGKATMTKSNL